MALASNDLDFNIEFNFENGTSKFVIDDNTSYPADGIDYGMVFKMESPSGVFYQTPNAGDATLFHSGSSNEVIETAEGGTWDSSQATNVNGFIKTPFTIPVDANGAVELGEWKFTIYAYEPATGVSEQLTTSRVYTLTYDATHAKPTSSIGMSYDFLTATVTATDKTSYNVAGTVPSLTRLTKINYPKPTGTATNTSSSPTASVTFPNLYTGAITGEISTTAIYDISANYTIVYVVTGINSTTIDNNSNIVTAYSGLKSALANVDANTGTQKATFQALAEKIGVRLQAADTAFQSGNSVDAAGYISDAIVLAGLTETAATTGTIQVIPVATASAANIIDITGNASRGTEVIKTAAASGTSFKVQLTSTANTKLNNAVTDAEVDYTATRFRTEGIPESRGTRSEALTTGGGTKNITPIASDKDIVYTGTGTLSSNWTIQIDPGITAADLNDGDSLRVLYKATFTADGNNITIFGKSLSDDQILSGKILAIATYEKSSTTWHYQIVDGADIQRLYDSSGNEIFDTSSGKPVLTATPSTASSATSVLVRATPSGEVKTRTDFTKDSDISSPSYYRGISTPIPMNGFGTTTTSLTAVTSGTKNLTEGTSDKRQIFTGTTTLTGPYTITNNGTPIDGDEFELDWRATMTLNGNALTIFGTPISTNLAANGFFLRAVYDADTTAYRVEIFADLNRSGSIDTTNIANGAITNSKIAASGMGSSSISTNAVIASKIATSAVETAKIKDDAVTVDKLSTGVNTDVKTLPISFETGELGNHKMRFPWSCSVTRLDYAISKTTASAASVQAKDDSGGVMTTTSIPVSTVIGSTISESSVSVNNTFTAGDEIQFTTSGAGGKAIVSITIIKS